MQTKPANGPTPLIVCLIVTALVVLSLLPQIINASPEQAQTGAPSFAPEMQTNAVNRTAEIENILLNVDEGLMSKHIQKLQDFKTRYSYRGDKCYQVTEYIYNVFETNGLDANYDYFYYSIYKMRNVVGEKLGTSTSDGVFIICAHYDSTSSGTAWVNAPGADDNGSGTAAVMAAAEVLSDYDFNYTIRFIAFGGEEQGLIGSQHYADNAKAAGENISGVINLDMIGYNPSGNTLVNLNTNALSEDLANATVNIAQKYQRITFMQPGKNILPMQNSDHASFWPEYQAFIIIEKTFNNDNYHSITDTIDKLNLTHVANVTQIAIAAIAELAELNTTDLGPPVHSPGFPPPNGFGNATALISIDITDPSPLNLSSIDMRIDGTPTSSTLTEISLGYNVSYQHPGPLVDGQIVNVSVSATDIFDNGFTYSWEFTVDATEPLPPTNLSISLTKVRTIKRGLAIDLGGPGEDDEKNAMSPSVIYHDGEYKMWYTGYNGSRYHIMYANSSDGLSWLKHGIVLNHSATGEPDGTYVNFPSVMYDGEFKMWYSGSNGTAWRIMYANSSDGLVWAKQGVVIDIGAEGEYDSVHAYHPSVLKTSQYEIWYAGHNGLSYYILYANSSDGIVWNKYPIPVTPQNPSNIYGDAIVALPTVAYLDLRYYLYYNRFDGRYQRTMSATSTNGIDWEDQGLAVNTGVSGDDDYLRATHCSAMVTANEIKLWYSGRDNALYWRILYSNLTPAEMISDLRVEWTPSASNDIVSYEVCRANDVQSLNPWQTYMTFNQTSLNDAMIGDHNKFNYYYKIRAIDKVGHITECPTIVGKIGFDITVKWGLIGNPFLDGDVNVDEALKTIDWDCARAFDDDGGSNPWKSNISGRPTNLNSLSTLNQSTGVWAHTNSWDVFAALGEVKNVTINMRAGWNLITYPHHDEKTVSEALTGLPYDNVEGFNASSPYKLEFLGGADIMIPGSAYWVHLTSAATWVAVNC